MNEYMKLAKELAKENLKTNAGGPFGAHAEIMAIRDACKNINSYDLSNCELYTSCYPCPMCLSAIIWSNIKVVYYGNTKEDAANIGFRDDLIYSYIENLSKNKQDMNVLELKSMDREETIKEFENFAKRENKIIY